MHEIVKASNYTFTRQKIHYLFISCSLKENHWFCINKSTNLKCLSHALLFIQPFFIINISTMKLLTNTFLILTISLLLAPQASHLNAQQVKRAKIVKSEKVKPLNARTLRLSSSASKILTRWKNAKHMELLKSGHFVPMQNPTSTSSNLPSGMPTSFADGTNCAKIECPDVFGPDVTCWECH